MESAKVYVPVLAAFGSDGQLYPRRLRWQDGQIYIIDRVIDVKPAPAMKAGGQGDRYTIEIQGKRSYLYFEHNADVSASKLGRWFVEMRA